MPSRSLSSSSSSPKLSADTTVYSVGGGRRTGHYKQKIIILLPQIPAYARAGGLTHACLGLRTCSRLGLTHVRVLSVYVRAYARAKAYALSTRLITLTHTHRLTAGAYTRAHGRGSHTRA